MTVVAAPAPARAPVEPIDLYRDDGPLARLLGRLGSAVPLPGSALVAAAAVAFLVALVAGGSDVSNGVAAAVIGLIVLAGGLSAGRPRRDRFGWAVPGLLRFLEYGGIVWLGAIAGGSAEPAAFALVCALAFRHYDLVYRLRHQSSTPPAWLGAVAGGWDGRLVVAWVLMAIGALPAGLYAAAGVLAVLFVGDSVASWRGAEQTQAGRYDDEDDEEAGG